MESNSKKSVNSEEQLERSSMRIVYVANTKKELNEQEKNANSSTYNTSPHSPHSATMPFVVTDDVHSSVVYSTRVPNNSSSNNNNVKSNNNVNISEKKVTYTVKPKEKQEKMPIAAETYSSEEQGVKIVNTRQTPLLYEAKDVNSTRHKQNNDKPTERSTDFYDKSKQNSKTRSKKHNTIIFDRAPASMPFFSMLEMRSSMLRLRKEERHYYKNYYYNNNVKSKESFDKGVLYSKEVNRQRQLRGSSLTILPAFHTRTMNTQIPHAIAASAPTPQLSIEYKRKTHLQELQEHQQRQESNNVHQEAVSRPILSSLSSTSLSLLPSELSYTSELPSVVIKKENSSIGKEEQQKQHFEKQTETKFITAATQTSITDESVNDRHAHNRREKIFDKLPTVTEKGKAVELAENSKSPVRCNEEATSTTTTRSKELKPERELVTTLAAASSELAKNALLHQQQQKASETNKNKITKQCKSVRFSDVCNKTNNVIKESKSTQTQTYSVTENNNDAERNKTKSTKANYSSSTNQGKHIQRENVERSPSAHIPHVTHSNYFIHQKEEQEEEQQQQAHKEEYEAEAHHPHLIKLINIGKINKEVPEARSEHVLEPFCYHKTGMKVSPSRVDVLPAIKLTEQEQEHAREHNVLYGDHNQSIQNDKKNAPLSNDGKNQESVDKMKNSKTRITVSRKVQTDLFPYMEQLITQQPLTRRNIHDYIDVEHEEYQQQKQSTPHLSVNNIDKNALIHTNSLSRSSLEENRLREEVNCVSRRLHLRHELSEPLSSSSSLLASREKLSPFLTPPPSAPLFSTSTFPHYTATATNTINYNNNNKNNNYNYNCHSDHNTNVHFHEPCCLSKLYGDCNSSNQLTDKLKLSPHVRHEHDLKPTYNMSTTHQSSIPNTETIKMTVPTSVRVERKKEEAETANNAIMSEEWERILTEPVQIKIATTTVTTAQNNTRYVPLNVPLDMESIIKDDERDRQSLLLLEQKQKQQQQLELPQEQNEQGTSYLKKLSIEAIHNLQKDTLETRINSEVAKENTVNNTNCEHDNFQRSREKIEIRNTALLSENGGKERSRQVMHPVLASCCVSKQNVNGESSNIEEIPVVASDSTRKNITTRMNTLNQQVLLPPESVSLKNNYCTTTEEPSVVKKLELVNATFMHEHITPKEEEHTTNNNCSKDVTNASHYVHSESTATNSNDYTKASQQTLENQGKFLLQRHTQQMVTGQLAQNTNYTPQNYARSRSVNSER